MWCDNQTANADMLVYWRGETEHHDQNVFSLTFTVSRVSVELETSLTQAQERAISVETLAPYAYVVFTAFIHIYGREKAKGNVDRLWETTKGRGSQDLLYIDCL